MYRQDYSLNRIIEKALAAYAAGNLEHAATLYIEFITALKSNKSPDFQVLFEKQTELAEIYFESGNEISADWYALAAHGLLAGHTGMLTGNLGFAEYLIRLGNLLFTLTKYDKAIDCFSAVESVKGEVQLKILARAKKAFTLAKTGLYNDSVKQLHAIVRIPGIDGIVKNKTRKYLADVYSMTGQYLSAEKHYAIALHELAELDGYPPDWPLEIMNNQAEANLELGNYSVALDQYRTVLDGIKNAGIPLSGGLETAVLTSMAAIYIKLNNTQKAKEILDSADMRSISADDQITLQLFRIQMELNDPGCALSDNPILDALDRYTVSKISSDLEADLLDFRSYILFRQGNTDAAVEMQQRLVSYYRDAGNGYRMIGHKFNIFQFCFIFLEN